MEVVSVSESIFCVTDKVSVMIVSSSIPLYSSSSSLSSFSSPDVAEPSFISSPITLCISSLSSFIINSALFDVSFIASFSSV